MQLPRVYILTWCQRIELLYGTTLVFKTLRDGFPNAAVHVADAGSIPPARDRIKRAATACGAEFLQLDRRLQLFEFIERAVEVQRTGGAVFVDPDMCFWERIENWEFDELAAGRFIPRHQCDFTECVTEPRLHTSLLWIPDVARLRDAITRVRQSRRFFEPFRKLMLPMNGQWRFFDTACGLYAGLPSEMRAFTSGQLDAYDHLFSGSFGDSVLKKLGPDFADTFRDVHQKAQSDYRALKGSWRMQEKYFQARAVADQLST